MASSEDEPADPQEQAEPEETENAEDAKKHADLEGIEVIDGEPVDEAPKDPNRRVEVTRRFRGPLPHPDLLEKYDQVVPGLAQDIVEQWKGETAHRHQTIDELRSTDKEAMQAFYKAELRGQIISAVIFIGVLVLAYVAIHEHEPAVGVAALITAGGSAVWAMRRRSDGPSGPPTDLSDGDELERAEPRNPPDRD